MIKNNIIKAISLTTLAVSSIVANPIYVKAEDNMNIEQVKSEIAEHFNTMLVGANRTKADVTKCNYETTVSQTFKTDLPDEKLYCFNAGLGMNMAYYGLTSGNIYIECRGETEGYLTVFKNENVYALYEFYKPGLKAQCAEEFIWTKINGWSNEIDNSNWYYFKDSIVQTGWIHDGDNWYYCYSNGEMAHDTTIDGYYLNSSGAWEC